MIKTKVFDCINMKHIIQKKLYQKLNPRSINDYFDKVIIQARKSSLQRPSSKRKNV